MSLITKVLEGLVQTNLNEMQLRYIALHAQIDPKEVEQILFDMNERIRQNETLNFIKKDK